MLRSVMAGCRRTPVARDAASPDSCEVEDTDFRKPGRNRWASAGVMVDLARSVGGVQLWRRLGSSFRTPSFRHILSEKCVRPGRFLINFRVYWKTVVRILLEFCHRHRWALVGM